MILGGIFDRMSSQICKCLISICSRIHFIKPVSDLEESLSSSRSDPRREGFGRLCGPKREQCASLGNGHDRVEGLCLCPKDEVARVLASFTNEDWRHVVLCCIC